MRHKEILEEYLVTYIMIWEHLPSNTTIYNNDLTIHIPLDGSLQSIPSSLLCRKTISEVLESNDFYMLDPRPNTYRKIIFIDSRKIVLLIIHNIRGTIYDPLIIHV